MTNLEKHLAEHWLSGVQPDDWAYFCECGEKLADNDEDVDLDQVQRAHVAATWREARTARTIAELDALPIGTIIRDSDGDPLTKVSDKWAWGDEDTWRTTTFFADGDEALILWTHEDGAL